MAKAKSRIGAQMYTLREHLKTPADIARTCQRVKQMGYDAIQVSAFGPIDTSELARILQDTGLTCAATHVNMDMLKDTNRCLDYHQVLDCEYTAIGGFFEANAGADRWAEFAQQFSAIAQPLVERGLRVGYHNHSHELAKHDGRTALDILIENTDPSIWFEIDTYWIQHGGGDPATWIKKVAGRLPCVHFKDMAITPSREQKMCEVGAGNLNWPRILKACRKAKVHWYLVERDSGDLDPFESLRISLENMRAMGLK